MKTTKWFKKFLRNQNITRLALELGVSRQSIYNWINGTNGPEVRHALLIIKRFKGVYKITLEDIYGGK